MSWTSALYLSVAYTVGTVALFQLVHRSDPFAIFDFGYIFVAVPGLPIVASTFVWFADRMAERPNWKAALATTCVFFVVAFFHFFVVASISASV